MIPGRPGAGAVDDRGASRLRRWAPTLAGLAFLALMAALYLARAPAYRGIIEAWGIEYWPYPFLDTDTVLSAVRCLNRGVDVYVANPCDPLGRLYDYSPLWMVLTVFPMTPAWTAPLGLLVDLAFLLALALLPAGRDGRATATVVLGVLSSATLFAVERGNNDLVLFALVAAAAALALRSPRARLAGYALAMLAGLLKYYPLAVLAIAWRERPARFLAITAACVGTLALFMATTWHDLTRALAIIPTGDYFDSMFGAITVGGGLAERLHLPDAARGAIRLGMTAAALAGGAWLGRGAGLRDAIDRLTPRERSFLAAGALMVLACFMTAQNIGYRAVQLLLVLPSLAALARGRAPRWLRPLPVVVLALLWSEGWRRALMRLADAEGGHWHARARWAWWVVRESLWWWLATALVACVVASALASPLAAAWAPRRWLQPTKSSAGVSR